jgi:hypothetical protein
MQAISLLLLVKIPMVFIKKIQLLRRYSQFKSWETKYVTKQKKITNES